MYKVVGQSLQFACQLRHTATVYGLLIPQKSHSRVESCNSPVSIETLDFVRIRTFYRRDRSWIVGGRAYFNAPTGTDVLGDLKSVLEDSSYFKSSCLK